MTRRHHLAIEAAASQQRFEWLVESLAEAVSEVVLEGNDASCDPAVCVLTGFVAFHTHADLITGTTLGSMLEACENVIYSRNLQ